MIASVKRSNYSFWIFFGLVLISVLILPASARGGLLYGDPNAMLHSNMPWSGNSDPLYPPEKYLYANIDYAVYMPGDFVKTFTNWVDPTAGTQYVYAYQVFNALHTPASTDLGVIKFSVGVHSGELTSGVYISQIDDTSTTSDKSSTPAWAGSPIATSATWAFSGSNRIAVNYRSEILIYTSKYGPKMDSANLIGANGSTAPENQYLLPSPVPEPATPLILLIAGGLFLLFRKFQG